MNIQMITKRTTKQGAMRIIGFELVKEVYSSKEKTVVSIETYPTLEEAWRQVEWWRDQYQDRRDIQYVVIPRVEEG